jgi:hypothetical protein
MWRKATRPKALFLTTAAQLNSEQLAPLLRWVEHRLEIMLPADMSDINRVATQMQDADFKARVLGLLHTVDIHVDDFRVAEHELPQAKSIAPRGGAAGYFKHGARTSIEFL